MIYDPTPGAVGILLATGLIGGALLTIFWQHGLPVIARHLRALARRGETAEVPDAATPELAAVIDDLPRRSPGASEQERDRPSSAELHRWARLDLDTGADWDAALRNLTGGKP